MEARRLGPWLLLLSFTASGCASTDFGRGLAGGNDFSVEDEFDYEEAPWYSFEAYSNENIKQRWYSLIGQGPSEEIARQHYHEGDALFQQKQYAEAEKKYKLAARRAPDTAIEEDALFMMAECQFFSDRYSKALDSYGELLKKYDNSRHLDTISRRRFAVGDYWERLHTANPRWPVVPNLADKHRPLFDTGGHAIKAFQSVMESDSTGPLADDSIMQMANAYFKRDRYNDAADYYKMLRENYPRSEHQFNAHLLGLQSEMRRYQGPHYDSQPLDRSEKLADQLLTQFPSEVGAERERLLQTRQMLRMQRAMREMALAHYYDKGKHYAAARRHYNEVVKNWPQTPIAHEAETRLAQIASEPDHPPTIADRAEAALALIMPGGQAAEATGGPQPAGTPPAGQPAANIAAQPGAGMPPR